MEKKIYRSRISVLLMIFILLCCLPGIIPMIRSENILNLSFYITIMTYIMIIIFVILISYGIRYEITDKELLIKMWMITFWSHYLSQITSIKRSYNPISSFASSLKKLRINGNGLYFLISPAREQEFLETLKMYNPNIQIHVDDKKG